MKKEDLKKLSIKELKDKQKSTKFLTGIFVPIILALFYFAFRDYFAGDEMEKPALIIAICSVGGLVSLLPQLKLMKEELKERTSNE